MHRSLPKLVSGVNFDYNMKQNPHRLKMPHLVTGVHKLLVTSTNQNFLYVYIYIPERQCVRECYEWSQQSGIKFLQFQVGANPEVKI